MISIIKYTYSGCSSKTHKVLILIGGDATEMSTQDREVIEACNHVVNISRIVSSSAAVIVKAFIECVGVGEIWFLCAIIRSRNGCSDVCLGSILTLVKLNRGKPK